MNWLSDAPLVVKTELPVPSGPTKLNGPDALLLPAAWNPTDVVFGPDAVHDNVPHAGVLPATGFESFTDDVKLPVATSVVDMKARKPRSFVCAAHVMPLFVETNCAPDV